MHKQILYPSVPLRVMAMLIDTMILSFFFHYFIQSAGLILFRLIFSDVLVHNNIELARADEISTIINSDVFKNAATLNSYLQMTFLMLSIEFLLLMIYSVFFLARFGATPGKFLLKMKVVSDINYSKLTIDQAILRSFGYLFFMFSIFTIYSTRERRTIQDYLGRTVVIKT
ncbi:MAG: RDD family protein [Rickettsiaceae bacterium]|nr:RDD family protein [Rickettsiaceae bacterium]